MPRRTSPDLWTKLKPLAREKRAGQTQAEKVRWELLRTSEFKFRRQHAVGRFIVDFYCSKARLVVEVDGPIHEYSRAEDEPRQRYLESLGLPIVRFSNDAVLSDARRS